MNNPDMRAAGNIVSLNYHDNEGNEHFHVMKDGEWTEPRRDNMNRLEEIKANVAEENKMLDEVGGLADVDKLYLADIKYLLSKLEIAEKALEQFSRGKFHRSIVSDTWGPMVHMDDKPWEIAEKALQQIRE